MSQEEPKRHFDFRLTEADLAEFQRELSALRPQCRLDRDKLMYLAGQASARALPPVLQRLGLQRLGLHRLSPRFWPGATAVLALACVLLVVWMSVRGPDVVVKIQHVPVYEPPEPIEPPVLAATPKRAGGAGARPGERPGAAGQEIVFSPEKYFQARTLLTATPGDGLPRVEYHYEPSERAPASYRRTLNGLLDTLIRP
ncbi:MAG: hypothetical protein HYS13_14785 [Planctomycetia bacterium]|nr:hypothetical protein [Planctomycetia bacterium]